MLNNLAEKHFGEKGEKLTKNLINPIHTGLFLHPICTGGGNLPPYLKTDW